MRNIVEQGINGGMGAIAGAIASLYAPSNLLLLFIAAAIGSVLVPTFLKFLQTKWRLWFLLFLGCFSIASVFFLFISEPFSQGAELTVLPEEGISLRKEPSSSAKRIIAAPHNSKVKYVGEKSTRRIRVVRDGGQSYLSYWHLVQYQNHKGWAYGGYLSQE